MTRWQAGSVSRPAENDTRAASSARAGPAGPQLMRAMNERALLEHIRRTGPVSRAELARLSGLSKPTVGVALANLERDGIVRLAGRRIGMRGPAALLYELRPEAGFILGIDLGRECLRAAISDLAGVVRARSAHPLPTGETPTRVREIATLADEMAAGAGLERQGFTQVVVGTPGIYDSASQVIRLAHDFPGWERPGLLQELREAFGESTTLENDVALAALAERDFGHGKEFKTFGFVCVGQCVGMRLVMNGELYRGAHGAAGEIAYLPIVSPERVSPDDVRLRGRLEASTSAAAVVSRARRSGLGGPLSVRRIFASAAAGDAKAQAVVSEEAELVARAIGSIVTVVDPELVVLAGVIGRAEGFKEAVAEALGSLVPLVPEMRVSTLGEESVVDGCLVAGTDLAWSRILGHLQASGGAARPRVASRR